MRLVGHMDCENCINNVVNENCINNVVKLKVHDHLRDLGVDGRITLKFN